MIRYPEIYGKGEIRQKYFLMKRMATNLNKIADLSLLI